MYIDASLVVVAMRAAQLGGVGADVLASFNNGMIYSFQEGEIINPSDPAMDRPEIRKYVEI